MRRIGVIGLLTLWMSGAAFAQVVRHVAPNEPIAANRTVCFYLVDASDAFTPETGEAGGQPQIMVDTGNWTNTGIGTLTAISSGTNGQYCAVVTQATLTRNSIITTRYKSANTGEARGWVLQVDFGIWAGTAQTGSTATTIKLDTGASATSNIYRNRQVEITGGTGVGQGARKIVTYVGSTRVATIDVAWTTTPDNTSTFRIY